MKEPMSFAAFFRKSCPKGSQYQNKTPEDASTLGECEIRSLSSPMHCLCKGPRLSNSRHPGLSVLVLPAHASELKGQRKKALGNTRWAKVARSGLGNRGKRGRDKGTLAMGDTRSLGSPAEMAGTGPAQPASLPLHPLRHHVLLFAFAGPPPF